MPDFYATFAGIEDKGAVLKDALVTLFEKLLAEGTLSADEQGKVARLLARTRIDL